MADAKKNNANAVIVPDAPAPGRTIAPEDIRPLKAPVEIASAAWILWTVLLTLLVAGLALAWMVSRRKSRHIVLPPPPPPPAVRARQRLKEALSLINEPKPFCVEVSAALRDYLEERFRLHAPDRTTEEFLAELQGSQTLDPAQRVALGDFLTKCDLAKFARYRPGMTELMVLQSAAIELVNQTDKPTPTPSLIPSPATTATPPALAQR